MKFIFGLGNPGKKYAGTRHNVGWDVVTLAAEELRAAEFQNKNVFKAELTEARVGEEKILFVHPLTFMNLSGDSVRAILNFYKGETQDVLIVHDEMDFPLGTFALVAEAGPAGHNGVSSIQESLGTRSIARLRFGIGRPVPPMAGEAFVLLPFLAEERTAIEKTKHQAALAILDWIKLGTAAAMNKWNQKKNSYADLDG